MASGTLDAVAGTFNVIGINANLQDSANPKLEAFAGVISLVGIDAALSRTMELVADPGIFKIDGKGITDLAWGDFPRQVVSLEFEPLPEEFITIAAWPFVTEVIPFNDEFIDEIIGANSYPYVTNVTVLEEYLEQVGTIIQNPTLVIDLEFQPLPQLNAIVGTDFNIIPLGCLDPPAEYWG